MSSGLEMIANDNLSAKHSSRNRKFTFLDISLSIIDSCFLKRIDYFGANVFYPQKFTHEMNHQEGECN